MIWGGTCHRIVGPTFSFTVAKVASTVSRATRTVIVTGSLAAPGGGEVQLTKTKAAPSPRSLNALGIARITVEETGPDLEMWLFSFARPALLRGTYAKSSRAIAFSVFITPSPDY